MANKPLHVLVLYDLPEPTVDHSQQNYLLKNEDRPTERDVCRAIQKLGMQLSVFGVFDDVSAVSNEIRRCKPDVIFNLCETFRGDRSHEGNVAALIELEGVVMTGSHSDALHLCKDKAITKKILGYDGIRVPRFYTAARGELFEASKVSFPSIVKPLNREASEGIAQASVVHDQKSCAERVSFIHKSLNADAIVEEFIHGRELYVGVLSMGAEVQALPARELFMHNLKNDQAMIATYRAKWDDEYRERWGVTTSRSGPIPAVVSQKLFDDSIKIFSSLGMRGYARMDWRMTSDGEPVFLEANPNPALAQNDDFAKAAKTRGFSYTELILTIIESALISRGISSILSSRTTR